MENGEKKVLKILVSRSLKIIIYNKLAICSLAVIAWGFTSGAAIAAPGMKTICTNEQMSALVKGIGHDVKIGLVSNGPKLDSGVEFVEAKGELPSYCRVTGSFVTNKSTAKTANFIATLPEKWNGKFLQLGCSGGCGYLLMNDPTSPLITISAQGYPGQLIEKGYAVFGNDLGHTAASPTEPLSWAKQANGSPDPDAVEDYLYRADSILTDMGKAFTEALYSKLSQSPAKISRSYFDGCSQGGRNALVAATRFSEKFDGIIAGSPVLNQTGVILQGLGLGLRSQRGDVTALTNDQLAFINKTILEKCDAKDGVIDGLIQNPAACNIQSLRDFPVCKDGKNSNQCLTQGQADAISARLSAVIDNSGNILQPGFPVSGQQYGNLAPVKSDIPIDQHVRDTIGSSFNDATLATFRPERFGILNSYRVVIDRNVYDAYLKVVRKGTITDMDFDKLLHSHTKLFWYHNLSDEALTPYMSINLYKKLADRYGGYENLQNSVRLFAIPGSGHCGLGGNGPSNFDAIGALEKWVEKGTPPDSIYARTNATGASNAIFEKIDWKIPPKRSMPLCAFPKMASYNGTGDVMQASSWTCRSTDKRMLEVGDSGIQAGVGLSPPVKK